MWNPRLFQRIDWRLLPILLALMVISLLVISTTDPSSTLASESARPSLSFFTPKVLKQMQRFGIGWAVFLLFTAIDYNKLREWAWIGYLCMLFCLIGLFFTEPIQNVHRWYRIPFLGATFQPSEYAKLIVVITLSWFLERSSAHRRELKTVLQACLIVAIPFFLILKQPDLGTALVLCPITLTLFYLGDIHRKSVNLMIALGVAALLFVLCIFLGILSHEKMAPFATRFVKEYQYERLNPDNHHQRAALIALGVGGLSGTGWRCSEFTGRGWLPYGYTDSVFPAFGEEFGLLGLALLLFLFYTLIYFGFQVTVMAKDAFGRLLSAGVTVYLAMHIIVNIGMMCGLLPITGVPLILVSYGGSSVFVTMAALGILQSIYTRRFMF